jgi:hypothetical protein
MSTLAKHARSSLSKLHPSFKRRKGVEYNKDEHLRKTARGSSCKTHLSFKKGQVRSTPKMSALAKNSSGSSNQHNYTPNLG